MKEKTPTAAGSEAALDAPAPPAEDGSFATGSRVPVGVGLAAPTPRMDPAPGRPSPERAAPPSPRAAPELWSRLGGPLPVPRRGALEGIERIRQAVRRLAASASPPASAASRPEPQPSRSSAPAAPEPERARPAAFVAADALSPRAPAAFWERSYLSRSFLRTPR